jgi:Na+-translocating ferredoxin:NAD+ oxidoreductase RNF subunit RnfB
MEIILAATIGMVGLGLLFGAGLALASRVFAVQEDERVEESLEVLPGANCGACGYGGCRAYAEAVVEGEHVNLCTVGGQEVADMIAQIMGVEAGETKSRRAVVHCQGGLSNCGSRADYEGEQDCRAANITSGGAKACLYGCLGFGTCAETCPFDAITMSEERLPVIDPEKCTACGMCVEVCPRDLITLLDRRHGTYLGCSSRDSGKSVKNVCKVGCITCRLCEKKDPNEAVTIENALPVLDYAKAEGDFSVAAEVCPMNCYVVERPPAEAQTEREAEAAGAPAE